MCDCPFCPLIDAKVDCCGVEVDLRKGSVECDFDEDIANHLGRLVDFVVHKGYLKRVGDIVRSKPEETEYRFVIKRKKRNLYVVCFHCAEEEDSDDDPIVETP
jgi:hypothetical protein